MSLINKDKTEKQTKRRHSEDPKHKHKENQKRRHSEDPKRRHSAHEDQKRRSKRSSRADLIKKDDVEKNHQEKNPEKDKEEEEFDKDVFNIIRTKNNRIILISLIYTSLQILIKIAIYIFLSIRLNKSLNHNFEYFNGILDTWTNSPIMDISNGPSMKNNLISTFWPGTNPGCLENSNNILKVGSCSGSKLVKSRYEMYWNKPKISFSFNYLYKTDVKSIHSLPYDIWRNKRLTVNPMIDNPQIEKSFNYFGLNIVDEIYKCPSDTRNCGIIDSQGNYLCVKKSDKCPFNKIKTSHDIGYVQKPTDKVIEFIDDDSKWYFGRESTQNKILFYFQLGFDQPCLNPYFENINFPLHILDFYLERTTCHYYVNSENSKKLTFHFDTHFTKIDKFSTKFIFEENNILFHLRKLPLYDESYLNVNNNKEINLYAKNYFGLKIKCFNEIKEKKLSEQIIDDLKHMGNLEDEIEKISWCIYFNFLSTVLILLNFFLLVFLTRKKKGELYPNKINKNNLKLNNFLIILNFCSCAVFLLVICIEISGVYFDMLIRNYFLDLNCVDQDTFNYFILHEENRENIFRFLVKTFFGCGFFIVFDAIFYRVFYLRITKEGFYFDLRN